MPCEICGGREEISLCRMCARDEIARKTKFKDDLIEEMAGACKAVERANCFEGTRTLDLLEAALAKHKDFKNQGLL